MHFFLKWFFSLKKKSFFLIFLFFKTKKNNFFFLNFFFSQKNPKNQLIPSPKKL